MQATLVEHYHWNYPYIKPDTAVDMYYGKKVADPFRNLENMEDSTVQAWFKAQRKFCDSVLSCVSSRDSLKKEIDELNYSSNIRGLMPRAADNGIFYLRYYLKENVDSLFFSKGPDEKRVALFSTDSLNKNFNSHHIIDYYEPSRDGKYIAFGVSSGGDENSDLYIVDVEKKKLLPEKIEMARSGNPQWLPNGSGFFYRQLRYKNEKMFEDSKIMFHRINTNPATDKEIFSRAVTNHVNLDKIDFLMLFVYPGTNKVLVPVIRGTSSYCAVYYAEIEEVIAKQANQINWKKVCPFEEKVEDFCLWGDNLFYLHVNNNPNGEMIKVKLDNPAQKEVIFKKQASILKHLLITKSNIYLVYTENGIDRLVSFTLQGTKPEEIVLPVKGTIDLTPSFSVPPNYTNSNDFFVALESWDTEWGLYHYNKDNKKTTRLNICPAGKYDTSSDLVVEEIEVPSYDGVKVPLSIIYKKGIKLNGNNPTLITAYGAYGSSIVPEFAVTNIAWLKRGGVLAVAHVRGGGEKGDNWYKAGYKETKPNTWKDVIACAEYLIEKKFTSSKKLAAFGSSAGGIAIGRAITERPGLFKAAAIYVGFLNILRHEFSTNTVNTAEFGTVKDSVEFRYLYDMDMYHHILKDKKYPSILFTAGMNDTRVAPWMPAKVVAKMQTFPDWSNVFLFSVSTGGHFGGPDSNSEITDSYMFFLWQLGHPDFRLIQKK